jgi:hypothetical protein
VPQNAILGLRFAKVFYKFAISPFRSAKGTDSRRIPFRSSTFVALLS